MRLCAHRHVICVRPMLHPHVLMLRKPLQHKHFLHLRERWEAYGKHGCTNPALILHYSVVYAMPSSHRIARAAGASGIESRIASSMPLQRISGLPRGAGGCPASPGAIVSKGTHPGAGGRRRVPHMAEALS